MFKFLANAWKDSIGNKLTIIAAVIILVGGIAGVIYGVVTRAGDEGFMKLDGKFLKWDTEQFPLTCTYDDSITDEQLQYVKSAMSEYNTKVGKSLFGPCIAWQITSPMPEHVPGGITLWAGEVDVHVGGSTFHKYNKKTGELLSVKILISSELADKKVIPKVWRHELGHALGLDHDRTKDSIMYPVVLDRPSSISKKDINLLQIYR